MRADPCTFSEVRESLSNDEWEEIYGAVRLRMKRLLRGEQADRSEILTSAVAGLSQVRSAAEVTGSEEDYASKAVEYYLAFTERYEWQNLNRLKATLIKKAKNLYYDSKKPRKSYEDSGGMPAYVPPPDPEQALLQSESVRLTVIRIERFKNFMLSKGTADDADAVRLLDFCSDDDDALKETETKNVSFKSKNVIEPALGWDPDKVQRIRKHIVMRGKQFLCQEKMK